MRLLPCSDTPRLLSLALLACVLTPPLAAQGVAETSVIAQPMYTQMSFGGGDRKISQLALPIVVGIPFTERFTVDITAAFASTEATMNPGDAPSKISGLTDAQIRANYRLASQPVVFTLGVNVPTGQYSIDSTKQAAAGQIGNDFLNYPISSMGNGFAATAGVAYAMPAGAWNLGAGASLRKGSEFTPFADAAGDIRYEPADEYRVRINADRPVGEGQVSVGFTYSVFGEDITEGTAYSTGDRFILTGGWSFPVAGRTVFLSAWNLFRMEGQQIGADAPGENIFNVAGAMTFEFGETLLQPNVEMRLWQVDGARAGNLINLGARVRVNAGTFTLYPQLGLNLGNTYDLVTGDGTSVSGLQASMAIRYR